MNKLKVNIKQVNLVVSALTLVFLIVFPVVVKSQYTLHMAVMTLLTLINVLGLTLLIKMGHASIGQAAFMGIGAYTSALLVLRAGFSFWLALPLAGILAGLLGFLVALPTLRVKGIYFGILTFALGEFIRLVFVNGRQFFGGATGLIGVPGPKPIDIFGLVINFRSKIVYYYLVLTITVIIFLIVRQLLNSSFGRVLKAIHMSEVLTKCVGLNTKRYQLLAFSAACFLSGIAGSLSAHYFFYVGPPSFTFAQSVNFIIIALVGGVTNIVGPVISTVFLVALPEMLRFLHNFEMIFYGVLLIVVLFLIPGGISHAINQLIIKLKIETSIEEDEVRVKVVNKSSRGEKSDTITQNQ
ncbi:MAG: branched-chain amino acid ABC transporter permease [Bacillota bacterium]